MLIRAKVFYNEQKSMLLKEIAVSKVNLKDVSYN